MTLGNEQQHSSMFPSNVFTYLCQNSFPNQNPNPLEYGQTPAIEVDQNIQTVRSNNDDKLQSVKDKPHGRRVQMIPALQMKNKLPRIPKLPRQHTVSNHLVTQPLPPSFG